VSEYIHKSHNVSVLLYHGDLSFWQLPKKAGTRYAQRSKKGILRGKNKPLRPKKEVTREKRYF
jgi:hypothetical protein